MSTQTRSWVMKLISRMLGAGVILLFLIFIYLQVTIFLNKRTLVRYEHTLEQQKKELDEYKSYTWYTTLLNIQELEKRKKRLPWSKHIRQILDILQDLKEVGQSSNKSVILSDFEVSLDTIKLNGKVTTLKALYYNSSSGKFRSLFDRFQSLDFIRDLEIKNYEKKEDDGKYYNFVLHAKVIGNDK